MRLATAALNPTEKQPNYEYKWDRVVCFYQKTNESPSLQPKIIVKEHIIIRRRIQLTNHDQHRVQIPEDQVEIKGPSLHGAEIKELQ